MKFFHEHSNVHNFGVDAMTAMRNTGKWSYWKTKQFVQVERVLPTIIIIQLGTNDAKLAFWNETIFRRDYEALVVHFQNFPTKPRIYLCTSPPLYKTPKVFYGFITNIINGRLPTVIADIGLKMGLPLIDNFSNLGGNAQSQPESFTIDPKKPMGTWPNDGCHLSDHGYAVMAESVARALMKHEWRGLNISVEDALRLVSP
jgi:lysophospholipase L1-like esterase